MPTVDIPLPLANSIYNLSFIALVAGTTLVFFSAIGLIWSGFARERHAAEKVRSVEQITTQADAALEKAKADVAEANRQVSIAKAAAAAAEKEAADARLATEKPVTPTTTTTTLTTPSTSAPPSFSPLTPIVGGRVITSLQHDEFKTFSQNFTKGRVLVESVAPNPEAADYARQIAEMLRDAGYIVEEKPGSILPIGEGPVGVEMKIKSMLAQPEYAGTLQRSLEYVGISTTGELDDAAENGVLIFIGNKQ